LNFLLDRKNVKQGREGIFFKFGAAPGSVFDKPAKQKCKKRVVSRVVNRCTASSAHTITAKDSQSSKRGSIPRGGAIEVKMGKVRHEITSVF
jgi:hypothetical protein